MRPFILTHFCAGFPNASGWAPFTTPGATQAIVITGCDATASTVVAAISAWLPTLQFHGSYWEP